MKPKKTILCVDDNEQALSIRKILLETRGYRVVACKDGEVALEVFRRGGVDLVLTDLLMPGVDGSRLIEEVKRLSPQTPAVLISGRTQNLRARNAGRCFPAEGILRTCGTAGTDSPAVGAQARAQASDRILRVRGKGSSAPVWVM